MCKNIKNTENFISYLRSVDVKIWTDGGHLRCDGPKETMTQALLSELSSRKKEVTWIFHEYRRKSPLSPCVTRLSLGIDKNTICGRGTG